MKALHRLINRINERGAFIFLTPCISVIGNCSEEILFGLIRARREGKRLVLLHPFDLPWKFRFPLTNRELFDVFSPYRCDPPAALRFLARLLLTALYGPPNVLTRILGKFFGPKALLKGRLTHPALGTDTLWKPEADVAEFDWKIVERYRWSEQLQTPLAVGLHPDKRARAHRLRARMGIPENAWFACLHVRESGFYDDQSYFACRNATISNYIPMIQEVAARGGWVVRLGDQSMTSLPSMERVIDYPRTRFKSDLMDLYLLSECRFYIGMSSGILDTAQLFQRPTLLTNMTNMTFIYPRRLCDRGLPKHVYSRPQGRFLSAQEIIAAPWEAQHYHTLGADFELHENSPEELREAAVEFLNILEGSDGAPTPLQAQANRLRIAHGRRLLDGPIDDPLVDINIRYRIAARLESSIGSLSMAFLEKNWSRSACLARPSPSAIL